MKKLIFLLSMILLLSLQSCMIEPYAYNYHRPVYGYRPMPLYRPMPHYGYYGRPGYARPGGGYHGGYGGHRH